MPAGESISQLTQRNVAIIKEMEREATLVRTPAERLADRIAEWMGSWAFLISQSIILGIWIVLNLFAFMYHWDPYPFILLNLALSLQSAYAAPILMISQNRQAKVSDRRNHLDLQINMLAEQETTEILRLLRLLCERDGIPLDGAEAGRAFAEKTELADLIHQIKEVEHDSSTTPGDETTEPATAQPWS